MGWLFRIWVEFLNGVKHGKGKEFDYFGDLAFEGEYYNGERWNGKGIEYDEEGEFEFYCEYLNGKKFNIKRLN